MRARSSGILLPLFSLPSPCGIGDLGPAALEFIDFLSDAGQRVWQVLPITPASPAYDFSPYHSTSAFAFYPLLVSPELLASDGLIDDKPLPPDPAFPEEHIDYPAVARFKQALLDEACRRFRRRMPDHDYTRFCAGNAAWIEDYARFTALSVRHSQRSWDRWPPDIRDRTPARMSGHTLSCSSSTTPAAPWRSRACRRTASAPPGSAGGTPSTAGTRTAKRATTGGAGGWRGTSPSSTPCASTIFAAWSATGKSRARGSPGR